MNKRFFVAWIAILVVWFSGSFVVHHLLLGGEYRQASQLFRAPADAQRVFPLMILAHVLMSGAFVWIYQRGVEMARPWLGQGLRFGAAVALLGAIPTYLIYYVVQPLPGALVVRQILFDTLLVLILGIVVAFLHRAPART
jgi:hypothetical protein